MSTDASPDEKTWHEAACHCHAVEYRVLLPALYPPAKPWINRCDCSICMKNGYLLMYPLRKEVVFARGHDKLKDYRFATKTRDHKFCGECGSSILIDFLGKREEDVLGINVRMIKGIQIDRLDTTSTDGRNTLSPEFNDETA